MRIPSLLLALLVAGCARGPSSPAPDAAARPKGKARPTQDVAYVEGMIRTYPDAGLRPGMTRQDADAAVKAYADRTKAH